MIIKEISAKEFDSFSHSHILNNYFQTASYGMLMKNFKYEIMYIGAFKNNVLVCASLILYKSIAPTIKYGYAPRGFLINYLDIELLEEFTNKMKAFFLTKNFAFIKINPEVIYSKIDIDNKKKQVNIKNKELITKMKSLGYEKLKNNLYFESLLPRYSAIINLKKFNKSYVSEKCYIKSHSIITSALTLKKGHFEDLDKFYDYVKEKSNKTLSYYKDFYKVFKNNKMIDLLLIEIDYYKYLDVYKDKYESFLIENENVCEDFNGNPNNTELYNKKIESDIKLSELKHTLDFVNNKLKSGIVKETIGGALLTKLNNRINLIISGFDFEYDKTIFKYFLYYKFMEYYKTLGYTYLDLNGISGNFTEKNPYKGLNDFKLSFNPSAYEYIGEFDLVINNTYYNILWNSGKLRKEFIN